MPTTPLDIAEEAPDQRARPNWLTLISVSAAASAFVGIARQALGAAIATRLADAPWMTGSTIFAQVNTPTRFAGACGTLAVLALGGIAALLVRVDKRFTSSGYFLWVFACLSLMNSGRLLYSALSDTGDWSVVISMFNPPWLWRTLLAVAGLFIYRPALRFAVATSRDLIEGAELAYRDLWRLVLAAYLTAGVVLTAGVILDPLNHGAVVMAVAAASFGLNLGLLVVPAFISEPVESQPTRTRALPFSWFWLTFACAATGFFLAGLGRAISF
jgi:hypothetical protein